MDKLLAVRLVQTCEKLASSIHGGTGWLTEEVVETDVPGRPPEKEAVARHGHFGKTSEAQAVVQQIDSRFEAENSIA